jgi:hypothetical protein
MKVEVKREPYEVSDEEAEMVVQVVSVLEHTAGK